jgi:endonuclease YncB( thermonuclease family)
MGGWAPVIVAGLVAGSALGARAEVATPAAASACRFEVVGTGTVAKVLDGRSFLFEDGREVRLAAVEVLPAGIAPGAGAPMPWQRPPFWPASVDRQRGAAADRYGRTVAHVYSHRRRRRRRPRPAGRAAPALRPSATRACAAELLSYERRARAARLGLWAEPHYLMAADGGAELLAERGRFTVVEGKVLSVRESGGTIYMNFGRRWSEALTVTILKRHERIFTGAGLQPKTLENRRLRVRGWVEERNGPRIEATHPEQIEIAELN